MNSELGTLNHYPFKEGGQAVMRQVGRNVGISMMLAVGLLLAGCGQEMKKENEQLKNTSPKQR